jgi:hypothetical protein
MIIVGLPLRYTIDIFRIDTPLEGDKNDVDAPRLVRD